MRDDDLYDLADEAPAKASHAAPVQAGAGADVPQRAIPVRPIAYKSPSAIGTSPEERAFAEPVKDLYAPLGLIGGGLLIEAVGLWFRSDPFHPFINEMRSMGLRLCISTTLMLFAIGLAARLRHFTLGKLPIAIMKLCAISIAPGAFMTLLWPVVVLIPILGGLAVWIVGFCLYFALIGLFFDLDQDDTWYCVCLIFLVNVTVVVGAMWLL